MPFYRSFGEVNCEGTLSGRRDPSPGSVPEKENRRYDQNRHAFSTVMAGGGFKAGHIYGSTDEFGYKSVEQGRLETRSGTSPSARRVFGQRQAE